MKVLYGIQATGNGHIARSRIMAKYLAEKGVDVTYLFSGRPKEALFDMEPFGDFIHKRGLTFSVKNGEVSNIKTAFSNNLPGFIYDVMSLPVDDFDLIITDFEPVTAWAGRLKNKVTFGIGHQYAFGHNTPKAGKNLIAELVMKYFAPARISMGLHWAPFDGAILPPIIDVGLVESTREDVIVVYLPFEDQDTVTQMLQVYSDKKFIQYSPELENEEVGNVSRRQTCFTGFKTDLCRASGVMCNSGFELVSECLHLGLPILVKPVKGQMEQESNALALKELELADVMQTLDERIIANWLSTMSEVTTRKMPDVAQEIVKWLLEEQASPVEEVASSLWAQYQS